MKVQAAQAVPQPIGGRRRNSFVRIAMLAEHRQAKPRCCSGVAEPGCVASWRCAEHAAVFTAELGGAVEADVGDVAGLGEEAARRDLRRTEPCCRDHAVREALRLDCCPALRMPMKASLMMPM